MNTQIIVMLDEEENKKVEEYAQEKQISKQNAIKLMIQSSKGV